MLNPIFTLAPAGLFKAIALGLMATMKRIINARLNQHTTWLGVQFEAFVLAQDVLQIPVVEASDRWGRRPFLLAGLAVLVHATLAQGYVTTSWAMLLTRIGQGIAGAFVFSPGFALAGDIADDRESGPNRSVPTMRFDPGTAIGHLAAGYLVRSGFVAPFAPALAWHRSGSCSSIPGFPKPSIPAGRTPIHRSPRPVSAPHPLINASQAADQAIRLNRSSHRELDLNCYNSN